MSQDGFYIEKIRFKSKSIALYSYIKHPKIDSYDLDKENFSKKFVRTFVFAKIGSRTKIIFLHVCREGKIESKTYLAKVDRRV